MRYTLKRRVLGVPDFIEISHDDFNQWKSAQRNLIAAFNIEQTFDLFLENYAEFARDCLDLSLRASLFSKDEETLRPYREVNRRLMNLLSSGRLYTSQVPRELNSFRRGRSPHTDTFKRVFLNKAEKSFGYCVMEALRNYSQHFGFPVHALSVQYKREDVNPGSPLSVGLRLFLKVGRLQQDGKFTPGILAELTAKANRDGIFDLTPLVPEYIEKLCEVHESLRGLISTDIASWDKTILSVLDRARGTFGEDLSGLAVVVEEKDEEDYYYLDVEWVDIFGEPIDWRKQLEAKNRDFSNLAARYVTGHTG
jgi:hypothetical protein